MIIRYSKKRLWWILALLLVSNITSYVVNSQEKNTRHYQLKQQVEALALGGGIEGRRTAILSRLDSIGIKSNVVWFDLPQNIDIGRRGANVTAQIPGGSEVVLMLGAHYDAVHQGQGVIDNASGVAVVLELADAFVRNPLHFFTVKLAFFDLEEIGNLGSRAMVKDSPDVELPEIFLNFDVFGYGEGLWIGVSDLDSFVAKVIRNTGTEAGLEVVVDSIYPGSDHISFRDTKTASYGLSLLDSSDIHILLEQIQSGQANLGRFTRIFQIIHTPEDTLDKFNAQEVARAVDAIELALRRMDAIYECKSHFSNLDYGGVWPWCYSVRVSDFERILD